MSNSERANPALRFFDKFAGIPLVFLTGLLRRKNRRPIERNRLLKIALLKSSAIGDSILLSGIIYGVKNVLPAAEIIFFTGSSNYQAACLIPGIRVISLPMSRPLAALRLIKKEEDIDLFVDCDSWPRINAMLAALSCARHIIGFKTPGMLRHFAFDRYAEHSKDIHEMENYRRLFCLAGFSCKEDPKVIPQCSAHPLPENKFTVIHMFPGGTGAKLKSWPDENWISVINYLTEQKMEVYLTGSPSDLPAVQKIKAACSILDKIFIAAGNYSLSDTACLLQKSEAVISVNTGIMHLAAAVGAKIIALHGPTAVKRWGPVSSGAINVTADFHCSPCLNLGFEYKCRDGGCMQTINAEMIINILKESII